MNNFLNNIYWNNTIKDYLIFVSTLILSLIAILIIKKVIVAKLKKRRPKKQETKLDDAFVQDDKQVCTSPHACLQQFFSAQSF